MEPSEFSISRINNQLNKSELFELFRAQLQKDFEQSRFPTEFISQLIPEFNSIQNAISTVLRCNEQKADNSISSLLYRVDISEKGLKEALQEPGREDILATIAELIISRELQKVITKQYYKR